MLSAFMGAHAHSKCQQWHYSHVVLNNVASALSLDNALGA